MFYSLKAILNENIILKFPWSQKIKKKNDADL